MRRFLFRLLRGSSLAFALLLVIAAAICVGLWISAGIIIIEGK